MCSEELEAPEEEAAEEELEAELDSKALVVAGATELGAAEVLLCQQSEHQLSNSSL